MGSIPDPMNQKDSSLSLWRQPAGGAAGPVEKDSEGTQACFQWLNGLLVGFPKKISNFPLIFEGGIHILNVQMGTIKGMCVCGGEWIKVPEASFNKRAWG